MLHSREEDRHCWRHPHRRRRNSHNSVRKRYKIPREHTTEEWPWCWSQGKSSLRSAHRSEIWTSTLRLLSLPTVASLYCLPLVDIPPCFVETFPSSQTPPLSVFHEVLNFPLEGISTSSNALGKCSHPDLKFKIWAPYLCLAPHSHPIPGKHRHAYLSVKYLAT